jgi:hypothetical protein
MLPTLVWKRKHSARNSVHPALMGEEELIERYNCRREFDALSIDDSLEAKHAAFTRMLEEATSALNRLDDALQRRVPQRLIPRQQSGGGQPPQSSNPNQNSNGQHNNHQNGGQQPRR